MAGRLDGQVAIVTGAGQGLGRAIAEVLCDAGASVALLGRTETKVVDAAAELRDRGAKAIALRCNVSERGDVDVAVAASVDAFGRLDILINNAQGGPLGSKLASADVSEEVIMEFFRTGPLGSLNMMQACFPSLCDAGGGAIVNFGSGIGVRGESGKAGYAMAKEAIRGLTKVTAIEWGKYGIRVNEICPAAWSPAAEEYRKNFPETWERLRRATPLRRMGDPYDDIGRAVLALVSDDMRYLTGASLMLDGGLVLQR
ncbi:short-chain dehydrogenase [Mycobacterium colombiense]|nr:short-chain dehydrogenase [Mycobacterium colombiense]